MYNAYLGSLRWMEVFSVNGSRPVSYTHLDVYKRQELQLTTDTSYRFDSQYLTNSNYNMGRSDCSWQQRLQRSKFCEEFIVVDRKSLAVWTETNIENIWDHCYRKHLRPFNPTVNTTRANRYVNYACRLSSRCNSTLRWALKTFGGVTSIYYNKLVEFTCIYYVTLS